MIVSFVPPHEPAHSGPHAAHASHSQPMGHFEVTPAQHAVDLGMHAHSLVGSAPERSSMRRHCCVAC